jgi:hypothetical protein
MARIKDGLSSPGASKVQPASLNCFPVLTDCKMYSVALNSCDIIYCALIKMIGKNIKNEWFIK